MTLHKTYDISSNINYQVSFSLERKLFSNSIYKCRVKVLYLSSTDKPNSWHSSSTKTHIEIGK